jgi:hypothetical protein
MPQRYAVRRTSIAPQPQSHKASATDRISQAFHKHPGCNISGGAAKVFATRLTGPQTERHGRREQYQSLRRSRRGGCGKDVGPRTISAAWAAEDIAARPLVPRRHVHASRPAAKPPRQATTSCSKHKDQTSPCNVCTNVKLQQLHQQGSICGHELHVQTSPRQPSDAEVRDHLVFAAATAGCGQAKR